MTCDAVYVFVYNGAVIKPYRCSTLIPEFPEIQNKLAEVGKLIENTNFQLYSFLYWSDRTGFLNMKYMIKPIYHQFYKII